LTVSGDYKVRFISLRYELQNMPEKMSEKDHEEDLLKDVSKMFAKRKAIAGVFLILAATFGVLAFTEIPGDITGYYIFGEPETDDVEIVAEELAKDMNRTVHGEREGVLEYDIGTAVERKLEEGYSEEEVSMALEILGEDPELVHLN